MKGWVGLVGWPVADGLPTLVVTRQLFGRAQDRESSPARDRRSTTVPCHQLNSVTVSGEICVWLICIRLQMLYNWRQP